jgi:Xaa-Pro aminopeptidase
MNYKNRCQRVQQKMIESGVDYLLVGPSADLLYLIGLNRPQSERLTLLVLPQQGEINLILPMFEHALAEPLASFFTLVTWEETEDPFQIFRSLLPNSGQGLTIGVASKMFVHFQYRLQAHISGAAFIWGGPVLDSIRMRKEPAEIDRLAKAGYAADKVFEALLSQPLVGLDEIKVKAQLMSLMTEHGHDTAGGAIVAAGVNGASPHHHVDRRKITAGDALVIDFGGMVGGYWSDMTRTIHIGEPTKEFIHVYNIVNEANQKAFEAVRPGVTAESIDQVARNHIADAGYGEYFLHRTGHGLGLEIHEPPYIVGGDKTVLDEGMVFSIEPGIYLKGNFGVRIEDIVVVTGSGARRFNLSTHDLQVIQP